MVKILCWFLICKWISVTATDRYKPLPLMYKMEDYVKCMEENDLYCKVDASLRYTAHGNNSFWKLIKESCNDPYSHNRNIIHRAICVPKMEGGNLDSIKKFTETRINVEIKNTSLRSHVDDIICRKKVIDISSFDTCLLVLFVLYIMFVLYATNSRLRKKTIFKFGNTGDKIITSFSLTSNWKKICKTDGNEDYNKLKSIQGIRFLTMLFVILLHTILSYGIVYLSNPEEIGKQMSYPLIEYWCVLNFFLVQTFFLISSWIATFQVYNIYRDHRQFTAKHVFILIINRYARFAVSSSVVILFLQSSWYKLLGGPNILENAAMVQTACKYNWWQTLFLVNNNLYFKDSCHPISWYLAADFQLYCMAIITIYTILKFELNEWKSISFLFTISSIIYGSVIYFSETDVIFKVNANFLRRSSLAQSDDLKILYTSTYSNWNASLVGIWLGIIYTQNKHRKVAKNKFMTTIWLLAFYGLPIAAILIAKHEFSDITKAILGALVKPLYVLGFGIGILGMSHNIGGIMKSFFENKYVVLMGNFSFSIYFFQLLVVFSKGTTSYSMVEFGTSQVLTSFLFWDAPLSIIIGIICALIFEQPGINLQKMLLPQIARQKQQKD